MASYKDKNREVKGYVEVIYNIVNEKPTLKLVYDDSFKEHLIFNEESSTELQNIYDTDRKGKKYAILEENYTWLDGSFLLFNKTTKDCGFISKKSIDEYIDLSDPIQNIGLYVGNEESLIQNDIYGVTIYAENNPIKSCMVTVYDVNYNVIETQTITNNRGALLLLFENSLKDRYIHIHNIVFENMNRRIMLNHIDMGISYIYENNELIKFSVTEELDKLVEKTPANELEVVVGDYDRIYDPLNKKGITKFLTEDATFIPYIGIANDYGEIEYEKMGEFYYDSINYQQREVTITAYNLMGKINKFTILNSNGSLIGTNDSTVNKNNVNDYIKNYLKVEYGIESKVDLVRNINDSFPYVPFRITVINTDNLADYLSFMAVGAGILYVDRNNVVNARIIDKKITNKITKTELLDDKISYVNIKKIDKVIMKATGNSFSGYKESSEEITYFKYDFQLQSDEEIIEINLQDEIYGLKITNENLVYTGCDSVEIIYGDTYKYNPFYYKMFIKVKGKTGASVNISCKGKTQIDNKKSENYQREYGNGENSITIDNALNGGWRLSLNNLANRIMSDSPSYEVSFNYNGDPTIKVGDYIEAESDYGYIPFLVTKHQLTFDGGLIGHIEGVE